MNTPDTAPRHPYTHGYGEQVLSGHRRRTAADSAAYLLPHLATGMRLLDVGSGAGTITADLARILGPGSVTAVEIAEEPADITRAELARQGLRGVEVLVGDAHALPLAEDSVDVAHAHQVLQHVADPVAVLAELGRVVRPGGLIAARDAVYPAFSWFPDAPPIDRCWELYRAAATAHGGAPDAGRRLLSWAHAAGFESVEAGASTWCYATPADREWWASSWASRISSGPLAEKVLQEGWADREEIEEIAEAWQDWSRHPDAWFLVPHGEILVRV